MHRVLGWGLLGIVLALGACEGAATQRLTVAVDIAASASVCDDPAGIDLEGTPVRVADDQGEELAAAALGPGGEPTGWVPAERIRRCRFEVVVDVPDLPSYVVTVGDGGPVTFRRADLERTRWTALYPPAELPELAPEA
jgi:hypothetical protein